MPAFWFHLIAACSLLFPFALFGQQTVPYTAVPDGWYLYPESKLTNPDEAVRRCFNYSRNDWKVTNEGDTVEITKLVRQEGDVPALPPLPSRLKLQDGMPGRTIGAGLRTATHIGDAWLLAYDAGEWGGGLWLTNEDGSATKRIVNDNVHAVVPIGNGILVLSGLAHMSFDFGNALFFLKPEGLNISLWHTVRLDGEARAYAKESEDSVLFVTTHSLYRTTKSGDLQKLLNFPEWTKYQYASSMAITSDGSIFVAMRMFVLRLRASDDGYSREWLLPTECRNFHLDGTACVCTP